jgi:hypothetical protein
MTYKRIASALSVPLDLDRIQDALNYYTDGKFFAEIYKNGTCVFPPVIEKKVGSGVELLERINAHPIDFIVKEMDDHNFIVRFADSVFLIVFADEFLEHRHEITQQAASAVGDEIVMGAPDAPQDHLLIGLYARTRLLEDLQAPTLLRSITPSI